MSYDTSTMSDEEILDAIDREESVETLKYNLQMALKIL